MPDDVRVYAIGDIHGCDVEFAALLALIDSDHIARSPKRKVIVLLGDLVDRGPDSAAVVERARRLVESGCVVRAIGGNHEEMMLGACAGERAALRLFARNGGRETALSYGIEAAAYDAADFGELAALLDAAVPPSHRQFMADMEQLVVIGDYAFVHAGVRPGVALSQQQPADLRWIRERFLSHRGAYEKFIVHGHTVTADVDTQLNRLGIDTGAYASGKLTAVGIESDLRWLLQT